MSISAVQRLTLVDAQQRELGYIEVEQAGDELLSGKFAPGPGFSTVARLFSNFEEAANSQTLGVVDKLGGAIAGLGLALRLPDGSWAADVDDVQIWSDGGFSCRPRTPLPANLNGRVQATQPGKVGAL